MGLECGFGTMLSLTTCPQKVFDCEKGYLYKALSK